MASSAIAVTTLYVNISSLLCYGQKARRLGVKQKILAMAVNSSGIRNTVRVLGISPVMVIIELKNKTVPPVGQ